MVHTTYRYNTVNKHYTGGRCISQWLLPATAALTARPIYISQGRKDTGPLAQAFISCHLDCCNSLFYGISEGLMSRLQSVQNVAARLVSGTQWYDHITPVLQELHWLPVQRRVDFKMVTLVYLSLSGNPA